MLHYSSVNLEIPDLKWCNEVALRESLKAQQNQGVVIFLGWLKLLLAVQGCGHAAVRKLTLA